MKSYLFLFIWGMVLSGWTVSNELSQQNPGSDTNGDSLLNGIQQKIQTAFRLSIRTDNPQSLRALYRELETAKYVKRYDWALYWQSYSALYLSIYYLKKGDRKSATRETQKAIRILKQKTAKNSEDYALLAWIQGISMSFQGAKAMFIAQEMHQNIRQALRLDSTNIRAYYVYASTDYHTPEKYGGGRKCEKLLLKAISLPARKERKPYLPSWGKVESYDLLIRCYLRKQQPALARKYYNEAIQQFPRNKMLHTWAEKLSME